jgi:hypothetical protein
MPISAYNIDVHSLIRVQTNKCRPLTDFKKLNSELRKLLKLKEEYKSKCEMIL